MSCSDVWDKLDKEKQQMFNRHYVSLASSFFTSACRCGFQTSNLVMEAMLHAITAPEPRHRYLPVLLVSTWERPFFHQPH